VTVALQKGEFETLERQLTPEFVLDCVARSYSVDAKRLVGESRIERYAEPRRIAMYLATDLTDASLPHIGKVMRRHHSTVLHHRDHVADEIRTNAALAERVAVARRTCIDVFHRVQEAKRTANAVARMGARVSIIGDAARSLQTFARAWVKRTECGSALPMRADRSELANLLWLWRSEIIMDYRRKAFR